MTLERLPRAAERRRHERALAAMAMGLVAVGSLPLLAHAASVEWSGQWIVALLLAGATAFGALHVLAPEEASGVPLATLVTPALASVAAFAIVPLAGFLGMPTGLALLGALTGGAVLLVAAVESEVPFVRLGTVPSAADRRLVEAILMGCALVVFAGIAATLPGGWARVELDLPGAGLPESAAPLAFGAAVVGLLVGLRLTVLSGRPAMIAWVSAAEAVLVGVSALVFRWLAIPGAMAAALLTLVLYLGATVGIAPSAEGTTRWRLEVLVIGLVILVVVGFRLFAR